MEVKLLSEKAVLPVRANDSDAGFDLSSAYEYTIPPLNRMLIKTDIAIAVPSGTYGRIAPRSGLAVKNGVDVGAGVIDSGYRGNVGVLLFNFSNEPFKIHPGDRIAQLILEKYDHTTPLVQVKEFSKTDTQRGTNGYGSSGTSSNKSIAAKDEKVITNNANSIETSIANKLRRGGKVVVLVGCMMASKTSSLVGIARRYTLAKKKCMIIKYAKDTRYSKEVELCTHDMVKTQATLATDELSKIKMSEWDGFDVILIDEGQFYPDLVSFCQMAANGGKVVVVAGLASTWEQKPFKPMCDLIAVADEITHLLAVCSVCGEDAAFTKRTNFATTTVTNNDFLIGGQDMFAARCRFCFHLP